MTAAFIAEQTFSDNSRNFKEELRARGRKVLSIPNTGLSYSIRCGLKLNNEQVMILNSPMGQYYVGLHGIAPARDAKMMNTLLHAFAFVEEAGLQGEVSKVVMACRMQHVETGRMFDAFPIRSIVVVGSNPNDIMYDFIHKRDGDNGKFPVSWLPISREGVKARHIRMLESAFLLK